MCVGVGPQLTAGRELVHPASQALGTKMELESIDEYVPPICSLCCRVAHVLRVSLQGHHEEDAQLRAGRRSRRRCAHPPPFCFGPTARLLTALFREPPAEREYLLEYYALVRAQKTNYVATTPMLAFFGHRSLEPTEFFKTCSGRTRARYLSSVR